MGTWFTARKRAALLGMSGAAAAAVVGLAAVPAGASPTVAHRATVVSGTEHFAEMTTSASTTTPGVIAYGVFTAPGVDHEGTGDVDTFTFPGGSFKVTHVGTGPTTINSKTCLLTMSQHGTYTLSGGTGKYKGISGHGTFSLSILAIAAKAKGACSETLPPLAFELQIMGSGPVTMP